ncbi:MAG: hypothetical protein ACKKL4_03035 [Patescibacteria group bacterium]
MKLGRREKAVLEELLAFPGDYAMSFLLSRGSLMRMYDIGIERREERALKRQQYYDLKKRKKLLLERLERKGLVTLVPDGDDIQVKLTKTGHSFAGVAQLLNASNKKNDAKWDGKWTLVMFDMPKDHSYERQSLVHLLKQVGFIQIQMSNYIFPYEVPAVQEFLLRNPSLGTYCQIFRGKYLGDDTKLREKFDLR